MPKALAKASLIDRIVRPMLIAAFVAVVLCVALGIAAFYKRRE
jgi:hypothetical protein